MRLENKIVIVTGANSGMGMATAAALSDMGAEVIMLCRSEKRGQEAYRKLLNEAGAASVLDQEKAGASSILDQEKAGASKKETAEISKRKLRLMLCDLGDLKDIQRFVETIRTEYGRVDLLVNNAGFISLDRQETNDGLERQFGVNHIGHFALTTGLVPMMPPGSRIVVVASGAHKAGKIHFDDINLTHGYNVVKAYSQSKLANVLFTRELSNRLQDKGITVNCCHPGAVATNMGVDRKTGFGKTITGMLKPFFLTPAEGARTAVFLATDPSVSKISGEYFYKCKIAPSSKKSQDQELAKKLYEFSENIVKERLEQ